MQVLIYNNSIERVTQIPGHVYLLLCEATTNQESPKGILVKF